MLLRYLSSLCLVHEDQASTKTVGPASSGRVRGGGVQEFILPYRAWQMSGHNQAGCAGSKEQADRAYAEALSACFDLEVEVHQHVQPYTSSKDGSLKWALLEMWPLLVSVRDLYITNTILRLCRVYQAHIRNLQPLCTSCCAYSIVCPLPMVLNTSTPFNVLVSNCACCCICSRGLEIALGLQLICIACMYVTKQLLQCVGFKQSRLIIFV